MEQDTLRKIQLAEIEILDEIVRLCNKHNIQYYLIGGSLLGSIRHNGFIPWDDDLDVAMPRVDFYKFKEVCEEELDSRYFLQDQETENEYFLPFAKVRKNNTIFLESYMSNINIHKGFYVDIFLLDNAKKQKGFWQMLQYKLFTIIKILIWFKIVTNSNDNKTLKQKIILAFVKPMNLSKLKHIQKKVMSLNKNDDSSFFINMGSRYGIKKQTIPKDKYFPPVKVEFEGKLYNAPNDWDYILTRIYGDYMKLPPIEKRITHNPVRVDFGDGETWEPI